MSHDQHHPQRHAHHDGHHLPVEHDAPDAWHRHVREEGSPQSEHAGVANTAIISAWFALVVLSVGGVVLAIVLYYNSFTSAFVASRVETTDMAKEYRQIKAKADAELSTVAPLDDKGVIVRIPIEQAMDKVLKKYSGAGH